MREIEEIGSLHLKAHSNNNLNALLLCTVSNLTQSKFVVFAWLKIPVKVNNERGKQVGKTKIFAGLRLDSFFLDFGNLAEGKVGPNAQGENSLHNKNVLSIVIETDI